jgi:hypothetical protein
VAESDPFTTFDPEFAANGILALISGIGVVLTEGESQDGSFFVATQGTSGLPFKSLVSPVFKRGDSIAKHAALKELAEKIQPYIPDSPV